MDQQRVLVVEDDDVIREAIAGVLEVEGYAVFQATNGAEALDEVRRVHPDLIVTDLMMPVMDGPTFVRECHEIGICNGIPVLAVSAVPDLKRAAEELQPYGVRGVLAKPFDLDVLVGAVQRMLRKIT